MKVPVSHHKQDGTIPTHHWRKDQMENSKMGQGTHKRWGVIELQQVQPYAEVTRPRYSVFGMWIAVLEAELPRVVAYRPILNLEYLQEHEDELEVPGRLPSWKEG